jgi:hypothetical protein
MATRYGEHRNEITRMFDRRFYRMWNLWLAPSAAAFRYGAYNLSQFVLTKGVNSDLPRTQAGAQPIAAGSLPRHNAPNALPCLICRDPRADGPQRRPANRTQRGSPACSH